MSGILLTAATWPIIGQIAWLLGKIMNFIYEILDKIFSGDSGLIGLSIIFYTIIVYTIMLPLTVKQQRTSKMSSIMNPELQEIQKKYRNKRDQASMLKQQEEMQQVYDKYGTSMTGGCLPMLIQFPLLLALYPVIYDMKDYVPAIKNASSDVQRFLTIPDLSLSPAAIMKAKESFDIAPAAIVITCIALPILSGFTQYLSIRLSQAASGQALDGDNPMAGTMKAMNLTMPLMSVFMVFTLSSGIGLYWIVSAVVRCVQQIFINKHLEKISVDDLIEENREKAAKKREKRGEKAEKINAMAQTNTRNIQNSARTFAKSDSEKEEKLKRVEKSRENAAKGSLAFKADMVKRFNENRK